jgi:STE24 endopeptidase
MRIVLLTAALTLGLMATGWAQQPIPEAAPAPKHGDRPVTLGEGARTDRVEVPPPSELALRYYDTDNLLWLVNVAWGILIPSLFLFTRLSATIRTWAQRLGHYWFLTVGIYFVIYSLLLYLIDWPLAFYQGFIRQHAYGLSNQSFAKWQGDSLKALLVGLIAGCLFLWVPYLLLRRSPRRWWLYTALLAVPFLFFVVLIYPVWVEPLFNDFGEMKDKALEARILALAQRAGIEGGSIYEVNKSVDTKALNAYVTGFLNTKRIVLWDTLMAKMDDRQILFIMGHEMGHYVLGHVVWGILGYSVLLAVALYFLHRASGVLIQRYRDRFGFAQLSDVASLPLLVLLVHVFFLGISPIEKACSRWIEHEADRFGLEITQDNHAAATSFVVLEAENLGNPRPGLLYKLWRATHPPVGERIDFCNEYRPWENGQPLRYSSLFHRR